MKKRWLIVTICFSLVFIGAFWALGSWNSQQGRLKNGEPFPKGGEYSNYVLTEAIFVPETGRFRLEFPTDSYEGNYWITVIQVNSTFTIYKNGEPYYNYAVKDPYKRIQQIPLTSDFFDPDRQKIIIEYSSGKVTNQQKVLIGIETKTGDGSLIYTTTQLLSLGALLFLLIYAISLFVWKPSEHYLFIFIVYVALQLLWGSLTLVPQYTDSLYSYIAEMIINQFSVMVSLLTVLINFGLLNIQTPKKINQATIRHGIILTCLMVFIFTFVNHSLMFSFLQFFRLIGGSILLIYACSRENKGGWILLIGYAISQGLLFYSMVVDFGFAPESIDLSFVRAAKISYLPYTFSIMVFINFKFASKFKESEKLTIELKDINKSLDGMVEERTNELQRQQAFRHNMMLNVIHDLRSPLFVIKGCTEFIPATSKEVTETLDIMKERIDFITHLTEDLFLIEQLEDDKVLFACEQVDLSKLLQTISSACKIEAGKKDIRLQTKTESSCRIWADRYRLGQAIQNLIVNAIYYTPSLGRVSVELKIDQLTAHIFIRDTGKGICEEDLTKVFERYYHSSENYTHISTGLGLSIAQEIITRHQGSISVESVVGAGSTFEVRLPVLLDD